MREFGWFSIFFRGCNHDKSFHNFSGAKIQKISMCLCFFSLRRGDVHCVHLGSHSLRSFGYTVIAFPSPRVH